MAYQLPENMRYLFRLEGPSGYPEDACEETGRGFKGAYGAGFAYMGGLEVDYMDDLHPGPSCFNVDSPDGVGRVPFRQVMTDADYFAFSSLRDCRAWWCSRNDLAQGQEAGFRLCMIPVEDVQNIRALPRQVVYSPKTWEAGVACPVIRRVYLAATDIHDLDEATLIQWADERLGNSRALAA